MKFSEIFTGQVRKYTEKGVTTLAQGANNLDRNQVQESLAAAQAFIDSMQERINTGINQFQTMAAELSGTTSESLQGKYPETAKTLDTLGNLAGGSVNFAQRVGNEAIDIAQSGLENGSEAIFDTVSPQTNPRNEFEETIGQP